MKGLALTVGLLASLVVIFVGERVLSVGLDRNITVAVGALGVLATLALRVVVRGQAKGAARQVETRLMFAHLAVVGVLLIYGASTDGGLALLGLEGETQKQAAGLLGALWTAAAVVSLGALLFIELAYRKMPIAEAVELRRVQGAAHSGLSLGLALVFLFSINYVANERNIKRDLSYFKTTRPSDRTMRMVQNLGEPVRVILFYPKVNEVIDQLVPFFKDLDQASENLKVKIRDHALAPAVARKHRVQGNGVILLLRGEGENEQAQQFDVGMDLQTARAKLKTLDGRFQESFAKLTQIKRELYLTTGHDERSASGIAEDDVRQRTRDLVNTLARSNIATRPLGMQQGLAAQVPEGAPAVAIIGPRRPFLAEEVDSLIRYVKGGGRVVAMLDPDVEHGLGRFLDAVGVEGLPGVLVNDIQHLRPTHTLADRAAVYSNQYSAHPTVTLVSRNAAQYGWGTVFLHGGALGRKESSAELPEVRVQFPIRSTRQFWLDLNGNYERDEDEKLDQYNMMAAVTVPVEGKEREEGRVVVIADGDFVTDQVIQNPGNAFVFEDVMRWLIGLEEIMGETSSEEDIPIEHTRDEDKLWFYATSFGVPLPVVGVGLWVMRRRRRRHQGGKS